MLADASCSGQHAALVHHQDARIFIIDLQSVRVQGCGAVNLNNQATATEGAWLGVQRTGTLLDGKHLAANKPTPLTNGSRLRFGSVEKTYVLECEATGAPSPSPRLVQPCVARSTVSGLVHLAVPPSRQRAGALKGTKQHGRMHEATDTLQAAASGPTRSA